MNLVHFKKKLVIENTSILILEVVEISMLCIDHELSFKVSSDWNDLAPTRSLMNHGLLKICV